MERVLKPCEICGILTKNLKYCSYPCYYKSMMYEKKCCKICGKMTKNKVYCSIPCKAEGQKESLKGKNNPFYGKHHTEETKKDLGIKLSIAGIKRFEDPLEHKKISDGGKQVYIDHPEKRKEASEKSLKRFEDPKELKKLSLGQLKSYKEKPERRENVSKRIKGKKHTEEAKHNMSIARIIKWQDPVYREKQEKSRKNQKLYNTGIELKIQGYLRIGKVLFETQKLIRGKPDIFIPEYNIIIFCDGDWYHANPKLYKPDSILKFPRRKPIEAYKIWKHDKEVTEDLKSQGYIVLRFWECQIDDDFDFVASIIDETIKCVRVLS